MNEHSLKKMQGFAGQKIIVLPETIISSFLMNDLITKQAYITDIGYYPNAQFHYMERPEGAVQQIIIYCVKGSGWIEINNKKIEVEPSQLIAIPAHTAHAYGANLDDPWTIYWVHFRGPTAAHIVQLILKKFKSYKLNVTYNENRIKLFEDIYTNLEKGYGAETLHYVNMIFYHFLSSLLYEEKFNSTEVKEQEDVVTKVIQLMQRKINTSLSLDDLSRFSNLSASHFSAVFKSKTGYTPIEYYNHLKIQKACQYLLFSDMSVKKIAKILGIDDPYYFSRMFSKLMRVSPREYRKRNKGQIQPS